MSEDLRGVERTIKSLSDQQKRIIKILEEIKSNVIGINNNLKKIEKKGRN